MDLVEQVEQGLSEHKAASKADDGSKDAEEVVRL